MATNVTTTEGNVDNGGGGECCACVGAEGI